MIFRRKEIFISRKYNLAEHVEKTALNACFRSEKKQLKITYLINIVIVPQHLGRLCAARPAASCKKKAMRMRQKTKKNALRNAYHA